MNCTASSLSFLSLVLDGEEFVLPSLVSGRLPPLVKEVLMAPSGRCLIYPGFYFPKARETGGLRLGLPSAITGTI